MAINDDAVLVIGSGNYFTAPTGTALPADLLSPEGTWSNVGHTSLEEIFGITSEGGEATILGTLQNKSLRTRYSARTETITFILQQFDTPGLKLYFGSNAPELSNGLVGVPDEPVPTTAAFLVVFVDGENHFAFYAPQAEIYRNDDISFGDTESIAGMPIGVKPKKYGSNTWTYAVTPLGDGVTATGATAGTPGTYSPSGAAQPANLAALAEVIATPTTAWTTGQHVELGDGTDAYWDGDSWAAGQAP